MRYHSNFIIIFINFISNYFSWQIELACESSNFGCFLKLTKSVNNFFFIDLDILRCFYFKNWQKMFSSKNSFKTKTISIKNSNELSNMLLYCFTIAIIKCLSNPTPFIFCYPYMQKLKPYYACRLEYNWTEQRDWAIKYLYIYWKKKTQKCILSQNTNRNTMRFAYIYIYVRFYG